MTLGALAAIIVIGFIIWAAWAKAGEDERKDKRREDREDLSAHRDHSCEHICLPEISR
jgi:hypothetical protein